MSIKLEDAIKKAGKNKDVKKRKKDGFYLTSGLFVTDDIRKKVEKWTLVYFKPETKKVFSATVKGDLVDLSPISDPAVVKDYKKLDMEGRKELERVRHLILQECLAVGVSSVFVTAKENVWEISIMSKMLTGVKLTIDAKSGKITDKEDLKLMR
jgi:hypothetical protein